MDELELIPLDDSMPLHHGACRDLIAAVMEQGVEDIYKNYPGALEWMNSIYFDHWCAWLNIDPTAARQAILRRRGGRKLRYRDEDMARAVRLHNTGMAWRDVAWEVFGTRSATILFALKEYNDLQNARRIISAAGRTP